MFEYIFFHEKPYRQFVTWLEQRALAPQVLHDSDSFVVALTEEIDDALADEIDEQYDRLLDRNRDMMAAEEARQGDFHLAAITITLQDGSVSYAEVDPAIMGRIMGVVSPEQFGQVVEAIARAVESPRKHSPCKDRGRR